MAVHSAFAESTGGMGSLNDRLLGCDGDPVTPLEAFDANTRLRKLVDEVRAAAEAALQARLPTRFRGVMLTSIAKGEA